MKPIIIFFIGFVTCVYISIVFIESKGSHDHIKDITVHDELVPSHLIERTIKVTDNLHLLPRDSFIKKYPCIACHIKDKLNTVLKIDKLNLTHGSIVMNHAQNFEMKCNNCHSNEDPADLRLINDKKTSFNRVDLLCSQCHFQQEKDWRGGAHGKSIHRWDSSPRIIQSCTSCHDPHQPKLKSSWPIILPNIPRQNKVSDP